MSKFACLLKVVFLFSLCSSLLGQQPTVIYSNLPNTPTNQIPDNLGFWDTDFSFFTLNISPSGEYWLLNFQEENTNPEVLIAGSGQVGSAVLVEGVDGFLGRTIDGIDSSGRINDAGQWVVGGDLSGSTADDDVIVGGDLNGVSTLYAQEGAAIENDFGFGAGNTWDTLDSTAIDASGKVYWVSDGIDGPAFDSTNDEFVATSDFTVIAQKGVDVPSNQPVKPRAYDDFDLDDLHVSSDGLQWMVRGDIGTPTIDDDCLFVNNSIVVREGITLTEVGILDAEALTLPVDGLTGGIDQQFMAGNGDWYVFGQLNDDETNWAIRNGVLIAASGDEIFPGANEFWDDPNSDIQDFAFLVGNSLGDYLLGGRTTAGDEVVVLNGLTEVLRSGDAVNLDGDTSSVFIDSFEFQETRLGNNGAVYSLVNFEDVNGSPIGSGFIEFFVETVLLGDVNRDGEINLLDVAPFVELLANNEFQIEADTNQDGAVNLLDVDPFIALLAGN
ncbi:MAG: dockerin type I domain-containing protein [Planctomycetota bacterium]